MQDLNKTNGREFGSLSHPPSEQWMSFVYGELPRADKAALDTHLRSCGQCRAEVATWRQAIDGLDRWHLHDLPPAECEASVFWPVLRWALAALVILGLGLTIGRMSVPAPNLDKLRASLLTQLDQQVRKDFKADLEAALAAGPKPLDTEFRRELRAGLDQWSARTVAAAGTENQRLLAEFVQADAARRQQEREVTLALFRQGEQKRRADFYDLRVALETVAAVSAAKFNHTDSELGQLASFTEAVFTPESTIKSNPR
jgi:hypothetical protein